jgi:hypothetical protein
MIKTILITADPPPISNPSTLESILCEKTSIKEKGTPINRAIVKIPQVTEK